MKFSILSEEGGCYDINIDISALHTPTGNMDTTPVD